MKNNQIFSFTFQLYWRSGFLIFLFTLILSCSNNFKESDNPQNYIEISNDEISPSAALDRIVDKIEFVPLETNLSGYITDWNRQMLASSDRLFIMTEREEIAIFNILTGDFIKKLSPSGEGPGEFSGVNNLLFNPYLDQLEVYSAFQRKNLIFDKNGKFINEQELHMFCESRFYYDPNTVVFSAHQENSELIASDTSKRVIFLDKYNLKTKAYLSISPAESRLSHLIMPYNFWKVENELIWGESMNNHIYTIGPNGVKLRYLVKFKENNMPEDFWLKNKKYGDMVDALTKENIPFVQSNFFESKKYFIFNYSYKKNVMHFTVYDKKRRKIVINTSQILYNKWKIGLPMSLIPYKDGFLFLIDSNYFIKLVDSHPDPDVLPRKMHEIRKNIKNNDNPILMKIEIK